MGAPQQNLAQPGNLRSIARDAGLVAKSGKPFSLVARTHGNQPVTATSRRPNPVEVTLIEGIGLVTELTGHSGDPLLTHILEFVRRKEPQYSLDPLPRAAAARFEPMGVIDPDAVLVEQPKQQSVRRQVGVDQLLGRGRTHQHHRPSPAVLDIIGDDSVPSLRGYALEH